jgi:hypothetical protein
MNQAAASPRTDDEPFVVHAPPGGWTPEAYQQAIAQFTRARGRAPRTITMHPETLVAVVRGQVLREAQTVVETVREVVRHEAEMVERWLEEEHSIRILTSHEHARDTIVMT